MDRTQVHVREVAAETFRDDLPAIPLHLLGAPGVVSVQLRSTLRRVGIGAGIARRPDVLAAARLLPGVPEVVTSPVGGTFIIGGEGWLGLAAIGTPPPGVTKPLDWMLSALHGWLGDGLRSSGLAPSVGRIDGGWCPGFSDIGVGTPPRKLVGLGFRSTRAWTAARGVMAVRPVSPADLSVLQVVHRLIGVEVRREASTSLVEETGDASWSVGRAISVLAGDHGRGSDEVRGSAGSPGSAR